MRFFGLNITRAVTKAEVEETPDGFYRVGGGDNYPQPLSLTATTAIPVVWACVQILSTSVARSKWRLLGADDMPIRTSPYLAEVAQRETLTRMSPLMKWRMVAESLALTGNAYLRVHRRGARRVLEPAIEGSAYVEGRERAYRLIMPGQRQETLSARDVVAIHGQGFDGTASPSPIQHVARAALRVNSAAVRLQYDTVKAGLIGRAVIEMDERLIGMGKDTRADIEKSLKDFAADRDKGRVPVLAAGLKTGTIGGGISPVDLQLIELLRWTVEDVCRVFGVPPRMVYQFVRGQRVADFEGQAADWQRWSVASWCELIAAEVTAQLLNPADPRRLDLDSSQLALGTMGELATTMVSLVAGGIFSPNDARRRFGEPARSEGEALILPAGTPGRQAPSATANASLSERNAAVIAADMDDLAARIDALETEVSS